MGTNGKNAVGLRKENTVTVNGKNSQMKIIFLLLVMFGLAGIQTAWAKDGKDSLYIIGWPCDAFTMNPVIDKTRVELLTPDSTVIATAVPAANVENSYDAYFAFKVGVRSGNFIVRLTHPDYQTLTKAFTLKVAKREPNFSLGNLKMRRLPKTRQLGEAVVRATKIKFYTKGDTLIYNADAFNLAEGSMLDALVEQLPGAELKRDGRIFVNGKQVESLLLNGKDFFKGNNTVLLDNLPAYTVQHIKVYDKQSEFGEFINRKAGRKVDDGSYVMDVVLKREYQIGWLSNMEVGGGTSDRWLARLFALRFTPQSRVSVYANANNTHENRKPGSSGEWSPSDIGNGISTTESGGIDYRVDDKRRRWRVEGNVNASHSDTDVDTRQSQEHFQTAGNTFTRSRQSGDYRSTNVTTSHHFQFNLGPEENMHALELHFRPNFSFSDSRNLNDWLSAEFSANPFELENWESLFQGTEADKALTSILVNKVRSRQSSNATDMKGGMNMEAQFDIPSTSNIGFFNAGVSGGRYKAHSFDLYQMDNSQASDFRHRYRNQPADHLQANASLGIITPFDAQWKWVATTTLSYRYAHDSKENSLYRLDWLEDMADTGLETLPSTREALLEALDAANSYLTENDRHQTTLTFDGRYDNDIRRNNTRYARFRFTWKLGLTWHTELWDYTGQALRHNRRTAWMPQAGLQILRNTPGMKHELELQTAYKQQLPSMFSLMGLRFDSDPLNIQEGNTGLRRTDVFSAVFFYRSRGWLSKHGRNLSATVRMNAYRNAVATAQTYDAATGVRNFRPQNVNGNWDMQASGTFYTPLGHKGFSMNLSLQNNFYHSVDLTGTDALTPVRSTVCTNYLSLPVRVDYSRQKMRVGLKGQVAWNHAGSTRPDFQNINAADFNVGINGHVTLPWDVQLATDFTYFARRGYANEAMNTDDLVWNAQLSKSILKGRLTFALVGYDILGQLSNITYSVNSQGSVETWRNVIPRYGMVRVIFRFNKQPKKKP